MSTIILKKARKSHELLERLLNNTTLTTQRVSHGNVLNAGEYVMKENFVDVDAEKARAVKDALAVAEKRHARELQASLCKLETELEEEKLRALHKQKRYYEELAGRVAEQRDKAEEQRRRELRRHFDREKEAALRLQWEEAEKVKVAAITEACEALRRKLRDDFALEKEKAIADALKKARELFRQRELEVIERTKRECAKEAAEEAARVAKIHATEIHKLEDRYADLLRRYKLEMEHKQRVERDFKDLQTDYQRFMNHTGGRYHSDYMMHLRSHGLQLAGKRVSVVTYEELHDLGL